MTYQQYLFAAAERTNDHEAREVLTDAARRFGHMESAIRKANQKIHQSAQDSLKLLDDGMAEMVCVEDISDADCFGAMAG